MFVCVCLCKTDDRPKTNIKGLQVPSGQHQGDGVAFVEKDHGLKNSAQTGSGRDEE